jgi:hypothetical protein
VSKYGPLHSQLLVLCGFGRTAEHKALATFALGVFSRRKVEILRMDEDEQRELVRRGECLSPLALMGSDSAL